MCDRNKLRTELNHAVDHGDIARADMLMEQIMDLEQMEIPKDMPSNFAEEIQILAGDKTINKNTAIRGRSRMLLAAAMVLIIVFCLGTAAYAAGILFAKEPVNKQTGRMLPFDANAPEFQAATEYTKYMDATYIESYFDPWEHPIYADENKVKELSEKYGLKYATEKTCLKSMNEIKEQLKNRGLHNMLSDRLYEGISVSLQRLNKEEKKGSLFDYMVAAKDYVLDDNTLILSGESKYYQYGIQLLPEGVFPYMGLENGRVTFQEKELDKAFIYISESGSQYYCVPGIDSHGNQNSYTVFAEVPSGRILISLYSTMDLDAVDNHAIDKKYNKLARTELNLSGIDELIQHVTNWEEIARDTDTKAYNMANQKRDVSHDDRGLRELEKKYANYTTEEKNLYDEYYNELEQNYPEANLSRDVLESFLDQLDIPAT